MSIDSATGSITWSPTTSDIGSHAILVDVNDNRGGSTQQQFTLSTIAQPPNRPPLFKSVPVVGADVAAALQLHAHGFDPDGDTLSFSLATATAAIPIANHSFEAQVLTEENATTGSLTDWTFTGGNFAGAWNPAPRVTPVE